MSSYFSELLIVFLLVLQMTVNGISMQTIRHPLQSVGKQLKIGQYLPASPTLTLRVSFKLRTQYMRVNACNTPAVVCICER